MRVQYDVLVGKDDNLKGTSAVYFFKINAPFYVSGIR